MKKQYTSPYNPAVKELSDFIIEKAYDGLIPPHVLAKITLVLDGVEVTDRIINEKEQVIFQKDQILVQKESVINQKILEVQSKDNLLVQKEQEVNLKTIEVQNRERNEFIEVLQKLHPSYTPNIYDWPNNEYKYALINGNFELISNSLPVLKQQLLTKEFIIVLNKLNPEFYKTDIVSLNANQFSSTVSNWSDNIYKQAVIENNVEGIKLITDSLPILKGRYLLKNEFIELLHKLYPELYPQNFEDWSASRGKELIDNEDYGTINSIIPTYKEELSKKLNVQKENEVEKLKETLAFKETEIQNKDQLLFVKELEKQELLAQKEVELADKSFVKNKVINELQEDVGLKEKEALNLKIELLMKQLAFKEKEVELKDKALEDALEIGKQKDIVNELQGKLLAFKNLSKHDETLQLELSVIHFKVEESILGGNVEEMKELSKYLSELMKNPIEKEESLDISELLNNLSPVVHGEENLVQNPLAVINNFDINHINTTHSIYPSGEGSSFDIIQEESLN